MSNLADSHCVPCRGGVPPLRGADLLPFRERLPSWRVIDEHHILKTFLFPDFKSALEFVNGVGAIAEQEGHHPDICLAWGRAEVKIYTHKVGGLTESDFVLAAKCDRVFFGGTQQ